jgi:hypothetical protein
MGLPDVICIGYKYSPFKVLVFLGTKDSGSSKPGEPYIARFPDAYGNVAQRSVPRPDVISRYFNDSNVIDSHNQSRQYELALEKRWITQDPWFRLDTNLIALAVTDCWRAYKHAMPALKKNSNGISIKEFADRLAYDCFYNAHSDIAASSNSYLPTTTLEGEGGRVPQTVGGRQSDVSAVTAPTAILTPVQAYAAAVASHPFKNNPEREGVEGTGRP